MSYAVVTGGTSGIGKAISDELEEREYEVLRLNSKVFDLNDLDEAIVFADNVTLPDVLVLNAGILPLDHLEDSTDDQDLRVMNVNFISHYYIAKKLVLRALKEHRKLLIIGISSISSRSETDNPMYGAAKAALSCLMRSLACIQPMFIRTAIISPGFVNTNLCPGECPPELIASVPLDREAEPEEIRPIIRAILDCEYINGSEFVVDGGKSCM